MYGHGIMGKKGGEQIQVAILYQRSLTSGNRKSPLWERLNMRITS